MTIYEVSEILSKEGLDVLLDYMGLKSASEAYDMGASPEAVLKIIASEITLEEMRDEPRFSLKRLKNRSKKYYNILLDAYYSSF